MLFSVIEAAILALGAQAAPHPQANSLFPPLNFRPNIKAQGPPVAAGITSEIISYDREVLLGAVPPAVEEIITVIDGHTGLNNHTSSLAARALGDCTPQPITPYNGPIPSDDPVDFLSFP